MPKRVTPKDFESIIEAVSHFPNGVSIGELIEELDLEQSKKLKNRLYRPFVYPLAKGKFRYAEYDGGIRKSQG